MERIQQHIQATRQGQKIESIHAGEHQHSLPSHGGRTGQAIEVKAGKRRHILLHEHEQRIGNRPGDGLQRQIEVGMEFLKAMQAAPQGHLGRQ